MNGLIIFSMGVQSSSSTALDWIVGYREAEQVYLRELAVSRSQDPASIQTANCSFSLGLLLEERSRIESIEERYKASLVTLLTGRRLEDLFTGATQTTEILSDSDLLIEARERYEEALNIYQRLDPSSIETANCLHHLGVIVALDWPNTMLSLYKQMMILYNLQMPPLVLDMERQGSRRPETGNAEQQYLEALSIYKSHYSSMREAANCYIDSGRLLKRKGRVKEAEVKFISGISAYHINIPGGTERNEVAIQVLRGVYQ